MNSDWREYNRDIKRDINIKEHYEMNSTESIECGPVQDI